MLICTEVMFVLESVSVEHRQKRANVYDVLYTVDTQQCISFCFGCYSVALRPNAGHGLLIFEVS